MKTTWAMLFAVLTTTACLAPNEYMGPQEQVPEVTITSVETTFGADAIAGALRDVSMELGSSDALALAAEERGQSVKERRALLAKMLRDLELQLQEHQDGHAGSAACVGHSDAEYRTLYTRADASIINPGSGYYYATSYTSTTRTTDITQSTYVRVTGGRYVPYVGVDHPTGCGIEMRTNIKGRYHIDFHLVRTYRVYAETAHRLPLTTLGTSWTFATDSFTGTADPFNGEHEH